MSLDPSSSFMWNFSHLKVKIALGQDHGEMHFEVMAAARRQLDHKLTVQERSLLQNTLEDISYSFGATLEELDIQERLERVCIKAHTCNDPMEKLYYSCGYEPVCYNCGVLLEDNVDFYPQCDSYLFTKTQDSTTKEELVLSQVLVKLSLFIFMCF